jgi:hypothetical protein
VACVADAIIAPIDPPRRLSSLAFSLFLTGTPTKLTAKDAAHTPNVGRKRTHAAPLMRSAATPGHTSRIQRIFQDATAMMQLDVAYASSPTGSIDSRKVPVSPNTPGPKISPISPDVMNWRYSSASQQLAGAESNIREPFPALEPPSSGYLPPLPDSSSPASTGPSGSQHASQLSDLQIDTDVYRANSTELDRPLSKLHVNHISTAPFSYYDLALLDESPDPISEPTTDLDIFRSPAAGTAADSAKLKWGLNSPAHTNLQETIHGSSYPDPSVHQGILQENMLVPACPRRPDPSVHQGTRQPNMLGIPRQLPYRRANSRGSPLPQLKARYPTSSQGSRSSPLRRSYGMQLTPSRSHFQPQLSSPPPAKHFQPDWSNFPAQSASTGAYSLSTEAAKIISSSEAPDSRIRDSYHSDTLTPLAKPQARYKKTGIAAMTGSVGRYYGAQFTQGRRLLQFGSSPPRVAQGIPKKRMREGGRCSLEGAVMQINEEVVKGLNPNVTPYRKGREPKRPRRSSYWDKDIMSIENKTDGRVEEAVDVGSPKEPNKDRQILLDKDDE